MASSCWSQKEKYYRKLLFVVNKKSCETFWICICKSIVIIALLYFGCGDRAERWRECNIATKNQSNSALIQMSQSQDTYHVPKANFVLVFFLCLREAKSFENRIQNLYLKACRDTISAVFQRSNRILVVDSMQGGIGFMLAALRVNFSSRSWPAFEQVSFDS